MKKLLLSLLILFPLTLLAQQDSTKRAEEYCMVVATAKMLSTKVNITVDYGQEVKLFSMQDQRLKDASGKVVNFNSVIDALNFMASQGWKFVNAYTITVSGSNVYHYVLRRDV